MATSTATDEQHYLLVLSCPDKMGIVAAVAQFLTDNECNIVESAQFGDSGTGKFFLRTSFIPTAGTTLSQLRVAFAQVSQKFGMAASFYDCATKARTLILVSKFGHCLNDLLYRAKIGALPIEIPLVISNHLDFAELVAANGLRFVHLPVTADNKAMQEGRLIDICEEERIDVVVLARYMQVLSQKLCEKFSGRIINIHHSFLPSFKGARPYQQAFDRGVKLIGATAHYVTDQLDEGPIIEQAVERVHHGLSVDDYVAIGRDTEALVLARAIKWHAEHRVILNGRRTVVFR